MPYAALESFPASESATTEGLQCGSIEGRPWHID